MSKTIETSDNNLFQQNDEKNIESTFAVEINFDLEEVLERSVTNINLKLSTFNVTTPGQKRGNFTC